MLSSNVANSSVSLASALVMPDGRSVLSFNDKNYFNATYTAGLFGKRPFNIMKGSSWENRLAHVSERTGVPVEELVVTVRGGDDTAQGTWCHYMLAVKFMMRCNPVYENQVEDLVFRLHMGLVTTVELERIRDETRQLLQAKDASIEQLVETMGKMSVDKQALTAKINQVQSAFPIESFSEPKVIRCLIQPVLRLLSSLLTLPNGCMLREDFVTDVEEMLVVDLEDFKLPKVVTTVGSYTAICSIVKARHFAYNQTPEEERRSITSSAINVDQFAFLLHRFQGNITPSRPM